MHQVAIIPLLLLLTLLQLSSTTPVPPKPSRIHQRSINQPALITAPTGFNYIDDLSAKINEPDAVLLDARSTVARVQKILDSDPTLPRLTRGEIEDLFEEVTKEEYEKSIQAGDLTRAKHMRALMLVLPYNTNNTSENELQELYNRPPITKVISSEPKEIKKQKIVKASVRTDVSNIGKQIATTYKPAFRVKPLKTDPTTYHPQPTVPPSTTSTTTSTTNQPPPLIRSTETPTIFVTPPNPQTKQNPINKKPSTNRFSSHYNAEQAKFDELPFKPIPTQSQSLDPELEEILESLGFSGQSQSRKRFKLDEPPPEELSKRMLSSTIKQNYAPEPFAFLPSAPTLSAKDFTKDFTKSLNSPRDFGAFKPIPEASPVGIEPELEDYLKKFGLYPPFETRSRKALDSLAKINDRIDTSIEDLVMVTPEPTTTTSTEGTQKPDTDEEDYKKLEELLGTLRQLQKLNGSVSADVLAKLDPRHFNLSQSLMTRQEGPNPILETEVDLTKNEIKRQTESPEPTKYSLELDLNDSNSTTTPSSEATTTPIAEDRSELIDGVMIITPEPSGTLPPSTSSTTTTTTETPRNNLEELGDSFAGGIGNADDAEPLPPPRKNGFYFLSDWNSFLEVGEDPDKIVVRFDPKAGDPSRFIPVNVP